MASPTGVANELVAWFVGESDAEVTVKELLEAGISREAMRLMPGTERDARDADGGDGRTEIDPFPPTGFVASMGVALPARPLENDRQRSGGDGRLLAVETNAANHDRAVEILTRRGRLDRDEAEDR